MKVCLEMIVWNALPIRPDGNTKTDTASWFDHPRDLLHLVNVKAAEMPRPIIGIGHSFGGAHL